MANEEILADLKKSVETWDFNLCKEATQKAIDAKVPVNDIMDKGLGKGMETIGQRFNDAEIFLPQVVAASKTMELALKMLEPLMTGGATATKGTIVMGTVEGDIHEIGKNVCCAMLRGAGYKVIDIGPDSDSDKFLDAAEENDASIIAGSALMTTTLESQRDIVNANNENGKKYKTCFGGAPCSQEWCDEIGADGYSETAAAMVDLVKKLMGE
ncbi:MAG: cobalamin B12-binding domain-containing protein [Methanomethylophilus sp.]|jgi:corrinoid protein of di/trimethylamine methyltransferase